MIGAHTNEMETLTGSIFSTAKEHTRKKENSMNVYCINTIKLEQLNPKLA